MKIILGVKLYTLKEVGELLGIQTQTVSKYVRENKITAQRIGGCKYISEENLKEFLMNKE